MKTLPIRIFYAAMSILLFAACSDDNDDATNNGTPQANVYIAGELDNTAVLWNNGQPTTFSHSREAYDIAVSGNDIYVLGWQGTNIYYDNHPCYWKAEQSQAPTMLEGGIRAYAIAVSESGSDVYVGGAQGYMGSTDEPVPCYWKNGQRVSLPIDTPIDYGAVYGIAISGSDVYMAGNSYIYAVYWKNGELIQIADGEARGIAVSGNGVYTCGYHFLFDAPIPSYRPRMGAAYWKNGEIVELAEDAYATGIAVLGNDVYVCGYRYELIPIYDEKQRPEGGMVDWREGEKEAVYWKNGQQITLAQNAQATGIAVSGNDVYICGYTNPDSDTPTAVYWKNKQQIVLGDGKANAIVVK